MPSRIGTSSLNIALVLSGLALAACSRCPEAPVGASITIVTPAGPGAGGPDETDDIAGVVKGVKPTDARVVIYAHAGDRWWIQPLEEAPFTAITSRLDWTNRIHLGFEYAALLVHRTYAPPREPMQLPQVGGCVWALDIAKARH